MKDSSDKFCLLKNMLQQLWGKQNFPCYALDITDTPRKFDDLLCLSNQFYWIIQLPSFKFLYNSPDTPSEFKWIFNNLNFEQILSKINIDSQNKILQLLENSYIYLCNNFRSIIPYRSISCNLYHFKKDRTTYQYIIQTSTFRISPSSKNIELLVLLTDTTSIKSNLQLNTKQINYKSDSNKSNKNTNLLKSIFSHRELEIIHLLSTGLNSKQIASNLEISTHTVNTHRRKILSKSNKGNTAELIAYSIANHIVQ